MVVGFRALAGCATNCAPVASVNLARETPLGRSWLAMNIAPETLPLTLVALNLPELGLGLLFCSLVGPSDWTLPVSPTSIIRGSSIDLGRKHSERTRDAIYKLDHRDEQARKLSSKRTGLEVEMMLSITHKHACLLACKKTMLKFKFRLQFQFGLKKRVCASQLEEPWAGFGIRRDKNKTALDTRCLEHKQPTKTPPNLAKSGRLNTWQHCCCCCWLVFFSHLLALEIGFAPQRDTFCIDELDQSWKQPGKSCWQSSTWFARGSGFCGGLKRLRAPTTNWPFHSGCSLCIGLTKISSVLLAPLCPSILMGCVPFYYHSRWLIGDNTKSKLPPIRFKRLR